MNWISRLVRAEGKVQDNFNLLNCKVTFMTKKIKKKRGNNSVDKKFPLPVYEKKDDIYNRQEKLSLEDDELERSGTFDRILGDELDIPGSELDNANENIGEEDEENNYYSLGGDNHEDLEEDKA